MVVGGRRGREWGAGLLLIAVMAAAAGCEADAVAEPAIEVLDGVVMSDYALPLDAYRSTDSESTHLVSQAWTTAFMRCMRGFGFHQDPLGLDQPREPQGHSRLYGLADLEQARTLGYWNPLLERELSGPSGAQPEFPPEWYEVARGTVGSFGDQEVPRGGCDAEAHRTLNAGAPTGADLPLADRLAGDAYVRAEQDRRVQAAFAAWRDCMAGKGYDYADPWEPNNEVWSTGPTQPRPTDREVLTATADVECKIEVDLIDIWASVHTAYESQLIEQHAEALALIRAHRDVQLANALAILEGRDPADPD